MKMKSLALAVSILTLAIASTNLQAQAAAATAPQDVRIEHDLLGEKAIPADALYGVQTARAMENFQISGTVLADYPELINGFAQVKMAAAMGIELLTEVQYRELQQVGEFDTKSSSWVATPAEIRKLGGALFGDRRFGR